MEWDDVRPIAGRTVTIGEDLRAHSVADLEARVQLLQAEIERVKTEIAAKRAQQSAAAAVFRKG